MMQTEHCARGAHCAASQHGGRISQRLLAWGRAWWEQPHSHALEAPRPPIRLLNAACYLWGTPPRGRPSRPSPPNCIGFRTTHRAATLAAWRLRAAPARARARAARCLPLPALLGFVHWAGPASCCALWRQVMPLARKESGQRPGRHAQWRDAAAALLPYRPYRADLACNVLPPGRLPSIGLKASAAVAAVTNRARRAAPMSPQCARALPPG